MSSRQFCGDCKPHMEHQPDCFDVPKDGLRICRRQVDLCVKHAAAPDLLKACQLALRELRATDHRFPFEEAMEAAIAKATSVEGRQ